MLMTMTTMIMNHKKQQQQQLLLLLLAYYCWFGCVERFSEHSEMQHTLSAYF